MLSDDRVGELVEETAISGIAFGEASFDTLITPLAASSPDYCEWVKL